MGENKATIRVDIEEVISKLQEMITDGFVTAELTINESEYFAESTLSLKAVDISQEDNEEYGEVRCISDDF